jgi:Tol biopolymer transport system component
VIRTTPATFSFNNTGDVFVRDRLKGVTERVSESWLGGSADNRSDDPAISADGRLVVFTSHATNIVRRDTNGFVDVFVHDRLVGQTTRVSTRRGRQADGHSYTRPAISGDGRFVAFTSFATNLAPHDTNGAADIFVYDRRDGAVERVSIASGGSQADNSSMEPSLNADGRFIAFTSFATQLVPGDTNNSDDVFVHDRQTRTTDRVSVSGANVEPDSGSAKPSINADGRLVAFQSFASNLTSNDTNGRTDVFVHDRLAGVTERASVSSTGGQGDGSSEEPAISADGTVAAFHSFANTLVEGDTNESSDLFVHELGM